MTSIKEAYTELIIISESQILELMKIGFRNRITLHTETMHITDDDDLQVVISDLDTINEIKARLESIKFFKSQIK